jgi:hypothetical protein
MHASRLLSRALATVRIQALSPEPDQVSAAPHRVNSEHPRHELGRTFVAGTSDKMSNQFNDLAGKAKEGIGKDAGDKVKDAFKS